MGQRKHLILMSWWFFIWISPLHWASIIGFPDVIEYLVSKGANKNAKNQKGETPYDVAENDEIKELLNEEKHFKKELIEKSKPSKRNKKMFLLNKHFDLLILLWQRGCRKTISFYLFCCVSFWWFQIFLHRILFL